jgi:hypothetical protein
VKTEYAQFYVRIKGKPTLAPIRLPRVPLQPSIDPVLVLLDIKQRQRKGEQQSPAAPAAGAESSSPIPRTLQDPAARTGIVGKSNELRSSNADDVALEAEIRSGLCDEQGTPYADAQIRALAKKTLNDAGIDENRPYHIKHATVSFLYGVHMPPEKIALFLRQKVDSFTFFRHYQK